MQKPMSQRNAWHLQWSAHIFFMENDMAYVVKAHDGKRISYLKIATKVCVASLVDRPWATVFADREEAQRTIDQLPEAFSRNGIRFSIETE